MKKYRTIKPIQIRADAGKHFASVGSLKAGQEFWSDRQEPRPGRVEWAQVLDAEGNPTGWACIKDSLYKYLEEIAQPAPVVDPLPPVAEPEGDLRQRVIDLRRDVDAIMIHLGMK